MNLNNSITSLNDPKQAMVEVDRAKTIKMVSKEERRSMLDWVRHLKVEICSTMMMKIAEGRLLMKVTNLGIQARMSLVTK
jgi:hypothetical protein